MGRSSRSKRLETADAENKVRVKYELTFPWGSLHVTQEADAAYGLVPLTTQSLEDGANRRGGSYTPDFRTDIWLVGPQELEHSALSNAGSPMFHGNDGLDITDRGIKLVCSYGKCDKELVEYYQGQIELDEMELPDDAPPDYLDQYAHQVIVSAFTALAAELATLAVQHLRQKDINNMVMSRARNNFLIGLGGGTFISAEQLIIYGHVNTFAEVSSSALVASGAIIAYRGIKKYFQRMTDIRNAIAEGANYHAEVVAYDLNRTYSVSHFNHQVEEMFGPAAEDS